MSDFHCIPSLISSSLRGLCYGIPHLLLHSHCGSLVFFLDDIWHVDCHTDWHQENKGNLETMENHHKNTAFRKILSLSLNFNVPLAQRSHTFDMLEKHLKPNVEYIIQNKSYARNEVEFNGFDKAFLYTKHEKIHTGEKSNEYNEHLKPSIHKSRLTKHWKTQTGEKQYNCSDCRRAFSRKSDLIKQQTHTGEKPYGCSRCEKAFTQKSHLILHQRTRTGEKPYECNKLQNVETRDNL